MIGPYYLMMAIIASLWLILHISSCYHLITAFDASTDHSIISASVIILIAYLLTVSILLADHRLCRLLSCISADSHSTLIIIIDCYRRWSFSVDLIIFILLFNHGTVFCCHFTCRNLASLSPLFILEDDYLSPTYVVGTWWSYHLSTLRIQSFYMAYLTDHMALLLFIMLPLTEHKSSSQVLSLHDYLSDIIVDY